jgi:rhomboid protease GluP
MDKRRMCPNCRAFITTGDRVCPYCETRVGPRAVDRRNPGDVLGGLIPHARFTTSIILLINFGLFAATLALSMGAGDTNALWSLDSGTLIRFGAKWQVLQTGQWWRLVTAGFLHGGIIHILLNSWVLFDVGAQVEELYGAARMIVIYFAATVFGFYLSSLWSLNLSIGASAGIMGLIGAMIALGVRNRSNPMASAMRAVYVRYLVYMLVIGFVVRIVDQAAHIGGVIAGFCVAYVAGTPKLVDTFGERFWRAAAFVAVGLTAASFAMMYLSLSASG